MESLGDLARVKATVARILVPEALLVLNADDEHLRALGAALEREHPTAVAWFSRSADNPLVQRGVQQHGFGADQFAKDRLPQCNSAIVYPIGMPGRTGNGGLQDGFAPAGCSHRLTQ